MQRLIAAAAVCVAQCVYLLNCE